MKKMTFTHEAVLIFQLSPFGTLLEAKAVNLVVLHVVFPCLWYTSEPSCLAVKNMFLSLTQTRFCFQVINTYASSALHPYTSVTLALG